jgi:hypothetical protein
MVRGARLSLQQEREVRGLSEAIALLFPSRPFQTFDDELFVGVREAVDGVQWHVSLERQNGLRRLAVNLEGLAYRDWPIARLIQRELAEAKLFEVILTLANPRAIEVHLTRDAWKGPRTRVAVEEWSLLPRRPLSDLSPHAWRIALTQAAASLAGPAGGRGSKRLTRLNKLASEEFEVSPHLNFAVKLISGGTASERLVEMRTAMTQLEPLHRFVVHAAH